MEIIEFLGTYAEYKKWQLQKYPKPSSEIRILVSEYTQESVNKRLAQLNLKRKVLGNQYLLA